MIPREHIESVVAHELMHIWLHQNTRDDHTAALKEGSCNYISYVFMKTKYNNEAKSIVRLFEKNADPVYGRGFRKIRDKFQDKPLSELLEFLKTHDKR